MGDSDGDSDGAADDAGAGQPGVRLRCYLDLRQPTFPPAALAAGGTRGSAADHGDNPVASRNRHDVALDGRVGVAGRRRF
ncbi:DUF6207 family protein [Streptomyces sp. NPDC088551]|uniref:DUF6207 family protein n=1 Tax=Streptomyces sp. NPDC088551 TaxID=3365863 RepID=UPI00381C8EEA